MEIDKVEVKVEVEVVVVDAIGTRRRTIHMPFSFLFPWKYVMLEVQTVKIPLSILSFPFKNINVTVAT